jgi:hypothetical protein
MAERRNVLQQFYERFGESDLDGAVALFSEAVRISDPGLGTVDGLGAMRGYLEGLKGPVPDARAVVERQFEAGDTVIVEGRFTGTNTGPLQGPDGEFRIATLGKKSRSALRRLRSD